MESPIENKTKTGVQSLLKPFGLNTIGSLVEALAKLIDNPPELIKEKKAIKPGEGALPPAAPRLIGLSGEAQSGKDMVAEYIYSKYALVEKLAISDSVIAEANAILQSTGIRINQENKSEPLVRRVLQELGYGRVREDKRYWCYQVAERIEVLQTAGARLVVLTGVRTLEEREFFKEKGAAIWKVERPGNKYETKHSIESEIKAIKPDLLLHNSAEGNLDPLYRQVDRALTS